MTDLPRLQRGNNPVKHGDERPEVLIIGRDAGRGIVDGPGDAEPAQPPASVAGDPVPHPSLGAAVALAERVNVVELVVVVCEAGDERRPVQTAQIVAGSR